MTRRIRILLAAATTVSLASMAGPTAAVGLGQAEDVRYKKSATKLAGVTGFVASTGGDYVHCDAGWRAYSAGQTVADHVHIADSSPSGLEYWFASAWHQSTQATTMATYATCLKTEASSMDFEKQQAITSDTPVTGTASCPEGDAAVGGGASVTGDVAAFSLNDSYPIDDLSDTDTVPDDGWRVHLDYAGQGGDNVTYNVMCVGDTPPAYRSKAVTVPASGSVKTQALCPKGRPAVGGGVFVTGTADKSHLVASRPWDSGDAGKVPEDGWRGGVVNDSAGALTMTVHAICR